jgi:predicted GIY-YIG superfamily endonuclease
VTTHRSAEHFVYHLRGKRGRSLYIGLTMDLPRRLAEHRHNRLFGHLIGSVDVDGPLRFDQGRAAEREAIRTSRPAFNIEHTPRHRRGRRTSA